jgi:hypothetical protein
VLDAMGAMNAVGSELPAARGEVAEYHARKHAVFHRMYEDQLAYASAMNAEAGS